MALKQIIVMRHDLGMRRGKQIAQGAHASMMALIDGDLDAVTISRWRTQGMPKICVRVDSEDELLAVEKKARDAGLTVRLVRDAGRTEFHGVETATCLAIGPADDVEIDKITGSMTLL